MKDNKNSTALLILKGLILLIGNIAFSKLLSKGAGLLSFQLERAVGKRKAFFIKLLGSYFFGRRIAKYYSSNLKF